VKEPWAIPASWAWATMGQLASIVGGGTPDTNVATHFGGDIPWVTPADLSGYRAKLLEGGSRRLSASGLKNSAARLLPAGALLLSSRAPIGYVAIAANAIATNQGFKSFVLAPGLLPDFYYYYLQHAKPLLNDLASGTTFLEISAKNAAQIPAVAPPFNEQVRIVETLEELLSDQDAATAALRRVKQKLVLYRAAVLKAAVEGDLTAEWRAQNPDVEPASVLLEQILVERRRRWEEDQLARFEKKRREPPKDWRRRYKSAVEPDICGLRVLPRGWCWATVDQAGDVRLGRQRAPQHHHGMHMRPYLRVANVFEDRLDLADVKQMNFTPAEFRTYELHPGDILLNEGQTPDLVGRPAMYQGEIPECCYQKTLLRFRAGVGVVPRFALTVFRAYLNNGRFKKSANITTNIAHLAAERFVPIEFPLPPAAEQEAIVDVVETHLSVVDHIEADVQAKLRSAQQLRQAILRHAFVGQLVRQHPDDEPASELLKRIAQARADRVTAAGEARRSRAAPRRGTAAGAPRRMRAKPGP
jgi:type I restriction enzyme S subunit